VAASTAPRRRALIVNAYVDETRRPVARAQKIPNSLGPVLLAGGFDRSLWDIRLWNELSDGPLEDPDLLGWADVLVMTGLTTALDRMRHLAAYARSRNPDVIVVAGGHVPRAFPKYCAGFMDYVCRGDVEEICDVIADAFGEGYVDRQMPPRYDLAHWITWMGYAETSRNCNFGCDFCVLTGEDRAFSTSSGSEVRRQLDAMGDRKYAIFLDNNFWGNDRPSFAARLDAIGESWASGQFRGWGALVTNDFYLDPKNIGRVKEAGCHGLFSGVESFDPKWVATQNKKQNGVRDQVEIIRECLESGLSFLYGLILDLGTRTVAEIREELDFIVSRPEISLPAFVSMPIPIPGTPLTKRLLAERKILPNTKIRDLDSTTISMDTVDPLDEAARFMRNLQTMRGYRARIVKHQAGFWRRYRRTLSPGQMIWTAGSAAVWAAPLLATGPKGLGGRNRTRTYVSSTEPPDDFYTPAFRVDSRFESHFQPTLLTDGNRDVSEALAEDLLGAPERSLPMVERAAGD